MGQPSLPLLNKVGYSMHWNSNWSNLVSYKKFLYFDFFVKKFFFFFFDDKVITLFVKKFYLPKKVIITSELLLPKKKNIVTSLRNFSMIFILPELSSPYFICLFAACFFNKKRRLDTI